MPDPRFHRRQGSFKLGSLCSVAQARLNYDHAAEIIIEDVAPLLDARPASISFFDNVRYRDELAATRAGACVLRPEDAKFAPAGMPLLLTPQPYRAYALIAQTFYPDKSPDAGVSPAAFVHSSASVAKTCAVEPGAVIGAGAVIGDNCLIGANAVISENVVIGVGCRIGACANVSHAIIGDNVKIYPGCRIGQDGFGFAIDPKGHVKVPQLGRVIIGDSVEIGANTTIDRGAGPDTVIGAGTWIDNLVQIGHNVKIGRGCIIVAQAGIAGSSVLEDYAVVAGQAGIAGHLRIGMGARVAGQSGVTRDVPAKQEVMGTPALPLKQFMRHIAILKKLSAKGIKDD